MRRVFLILLAAVLVGGCGAGRYGMPVVPGYEAAGVVAGNQAMVASIAGQQGWAPYGQPYGQFGNVPICRAQDLVGLPPINVSQPVLVRVSKSKGHRTRDIIYGTLLGGGAGMFVGGGQKIQIGNYLFDLGTLAGAAIGAGGAGLWANHEQELCLLLPVRP